MGSTRSSSKRKSSKKKSSKLSSEARRRKRSRKIKSKKLRRRDDSVSSYSDDESRSSLSVSSSSEEDYRRVRTRKRSDVKGSKKRGRRSYSSDEKSEDSYRVKKRRKSKRIGDSVVRKKKIKKKKKKGKLSRDASNNSIAGDSRSCSPCKGGSIDATGEDEFDNPRGRSRGKKEDEGDLAMARSGSKLNNDRSPSCSSHSIYNDTSVHSDKDKLVAETSSRRLRSVIMVPKQPEDEEKKSENEGYKEEIVYDHDEYPSCRSNDSNEYSGKKEFSHHSSQRMEENINVEEALDSKISMLDQIESGEDRLDQMGASNPSIENKSGFSSTTACLGGDDDMESILRQKALENLKKFRGGFPKTNRNLPLDETNKTDIGVKKSSSAKSEFKQNETFKENNSRGGNLYQSRIIDLNSSARTNSGTESITPRKRVVSPLDRMAHSAAPQDQMALSALTSKSELGTSDLMQESSGTHSTLKKSPESLADSGVNDSGAKKNPLETSESVGPISKDNGVEANSARESADPERPPPLKSTLDEGNSKEEQKDNAKDGSQYEQKTMSVMRGGEMVQVSYKVYIPKNARSLGRRQLRR